jgi:hypothetical protein
MAGVRFTAFACSLARRRKLPSIRRSSRSVAGGRRGGGGIRTAYTHCHQHWQNSPFWAIALEDSARVGPSGFHFCGFLNNDFFFCRPRSSDLRPSSNLEDEVPVFRSFNNRVVQQYSHTPGSLFIAFYDSQAYGWGILILLHTAYTSI